MIRNYITIAFRNFVRNRNYSLINILGLSIGITACILIFLLIMYDLNFDRFHSRYDNIYRVVKHSKSSSGEEYGSVTPYPFMKGFRNDFPDIPLATQMHYEEEVLVKHEGRKFKVENVLFADSLFFEVFDFQVLSGNPVNDLGHPGKAYLTESLANLLGIDPRQSPASLKIDNKVEVEVVGLLKDVPATSHIQFSMIVSMPSLTADFVGGFPLDHWGMTISGFSYVVLPAEINQARVEERFKSFVKKYFKKEGSERKSFHLQPLRNIHFDERYTENPGDVTNASYKEIGIMAILGLFILVIACINFINLSTALAVRKSREIGIRKTLGAKRSQLALYFLAETFLITSVAILISLGIAEWLTPWVNGFINKKITIHLFSNAPLAIYLVTLAIVTTLLSGFYPALILSGFNPASVLKNKGSSNAGSRVVVRKVLVVCQFIIAQVLIIGTLIISDQMDYFRNKPLGFEKEAVILVGLPENKKEVLDSFKKRLMTNSQISSVSFSLGAPTSENNFGTNFSLSDGPSTELYAIGVKPVDRDYLQTYGIELKAGRWFTENEEKSADTSLPEDQQKFTYILNESATKRLGFSQPEEAIGKNITTGLNSINAEVVGVVSDFHVSSLHSEIDPVVLVHFPYFYYEAGIKVNAANLQETIRFIEGQWTGVYPEYYFEYTFLDQNLEKLYRQDQRTFTLIRIFAGVSIFIDCLGLYGLVSFMANQKLKEVGIRKVLGASVQSIVLLFSGDFIKLILIAFAVAVPLGWYFMNQWLETFAFHISIHWSVFLISIVVTLLIALATVSYRSIRAAVTNPAETLRTE